MRSVVVAGVIIGVAGRTVQKPHTALLQPTDATSIEWLCQSSVGLGTDTKLVFNNLGGLGPKTTDAQPVIRATNVLWATVAVSDPDLLAAIRFLQSTSCCSYARSCCSYARMRSSCRLA